MSQGRAVVPEPFSRWKPAAILLGLSWIATVAIYWPTVQSMMTKWAQSRTFAHGFLILPATLYLIWDLRHQVAKTDPVPSYWGWLVLVLLGACWFAGVEANSLLLQQIAVVSMFLGLVVTVVGPRATRVLLFPLGLLFFAIPTGTALEPTLQDFTAWFAVEGLKLMAVPVFWEGLFIVVPGRRWEVATDCAGLRYLLPGLALGYMYVGAVYRRVSKRVVFLVICIAVLILANGMRAFGIILFDYWGIAEGTDHRVFSYTIYGATMVPFLWFGLHWRDVGSSLTQTDLAASWRHGEFQELASEESQFGLITFAIAAGVALLILMFWASLAAILSL